MVLKWLEWVFCICCRMMSPGAQRSLQAFTQQKLVEVATSSPLLIKHWRSWPPNCTLCIMLWFGSSWQRVVALIWYKLHWWWQKLKSSSWPEESLAAWTPCICVSVLQIGLHLNTLSCDFFCGGVGCQHCCKFTAGILSSAERNKMPQIVTGGL